MRLETDADHANGGVFCLKGKTAPGLVYHPDRLKGGDSANPIFLVGREIADPISGSLPHRSSSAVFGRRCNSDKPFGRSTEAP